MGIIKPIGAIGRSLDKSQIIALATADAEEVIVSGKFDMLKVYTELKRYELYLKTLIDKTKEVALEKAIEQDEKTIELDNARITIYRRRVYDFSSDDKWNSLKGDLDYLQEMRKGREALLKELAPGETREIVDEKTGEIETITAPPVETKLGLIVKL
ncbi:MAG TPA: hypothetical protein ENJ95_02205 [Bacteroidetes bacterium]|nr:hypothetical protein [Bacteroidota bacterium]